MPNNPNAAKNLKLFVAGQSGNPSGRRKGSRNRATIVKALLEIQIGPHDNVFVLPKQRYLQLDSSVTVEYMLIYVQIIKARQGDANAYKALMDAAYGKP